MRAQRSETAVEDETGRGSDQSFRIRSAFPADQGAALSVVQRCSGRTLFHRFHGCADAAGHLRRQWGGSAEVILLAWQGHRCVGIGEMAGDAHLGVLVEDTWQRRGVGTRLLGALVDEARIRCFDVLHVDILTEDAFLMGALRRIGPLTVSWHAEVLSVDINIESRRR